MMALPWPGSTLETWTLVSFVVWLALLAGFSRVGTLGRVVMALLSWLIARGAIVLGPLVVRWIR